MIERILLDMDDVLLDTTGACLRHMGVKGFNILFDYPIAERDIYVAYNCLTRLTLPPHVFWEHFKREFWASIPKKSTHSELIALCMGFVGSDNIAICTTPTLCGDCLAGKLDWIQRYFPEYMQRQYIMTPRKFFCASPTTILIDDDEETIEKFRWAKGLGIVYPAPWNDNKEHMADPMPFIKSELDKCQAVC